MGMIVPPGMTPDHEIPKDLYERMRFEERRYLGGNGPSRFLRGVMALWRHLKDLDTRQRYLLKDERIALLNARYETLLAQYNDTLERYRGLENQQWEATTLLRRLQRDLAPKLPAELFGFYDPGEKTRIELETAQAEHFALIEEFFLKNGLNLTTETVDQELKY